MAGKATIYDYVIESVESPAFAGNSAIMVQNILDEGGTCPTFMARTTDGAAIPNTDPVEYEQEEISSSGPMVGTKAANGKIQLHFRLPEFLSEADVMIMLKTGMSGAEPPLSVSSIRSGFKNLWVDDGLDDEGNPLGYYEYHVVKQANRATFLPFMDDITEYDEEGNPSTRPPNATDRLFLSGYALTENINLV